MHTTVVDQLAAMIRGHFKVRFNALLDSQESGIFFDHRSPVIVTTNTWPSFTNFGGRQSLDRKIVSDGAA